MFEGFPRDNAGQRGDSVFVARGQQKTTESPLLEEIRGSRVKEMDDAPVLIRALISVAFFVGVAVARRAVVSLVPLRDKVPNMQLDGAG